MARTSGEQQTSMALALKQARPGSGVPLVLVHAFPVDSRMWGSVIEHLPGDFAVWTVDLPGMGESPLPDAAARAVGMPLEPALEVSAAALTEALRTQGVERAVLAGLSMGGYVVLAAMEREPDFVLGAGLFDTKTTADPEDARQNRLRIADQAERDGSAAAVGAMAESLVSEATRSAHPDLVGRLGQWIAEQRPDGIAWSQRAMAARPDRTQILARFDGPVAVVVGEEDALSPVGPSREMAQTARNGAFTIISGAGHLTAVEAPEQVAQVLTDLMRRSG